MIKAIRRFIERGRKGYCYEDLWSFDSFLSKLIASGLSDLKDICHGYPIDFDKFEDWLAVLDEMVYCFEEQNRSISSWASEGILEQWQKRQNYKADRLHRGLELLEKYYYNLWD